MKIQKLGIERRNEFVDYCVEHRLEHDPTFINDDELEQFIPDEDNPTYILTDDDDTIIGAVSVVLIPRFRKTGRARFRIFHSTTADMEAYGTMLEAATAHLEGINDIFLFIPDERAAECQIIMELGFSVQRYAWVLKKQDDNVELPVFPEGYTVRPFRAGRDEEAWCAIDNEAFSVFSWHTDITPELIKVDESSDTYIKNGMLMLWNGEKPVGIINVERDPDDGTAEIGPIAILPEYQGKGLGRNLLRAGIEAAISAGLSTISLSVNSGNDKAADLYFSEGFKKDRLMLCYNKRMV